ncbi:MAG: hypothetical protein KDD60_11130 [Bdellovibrionales bacterium]|nr:hypothetical protein [Bdellovibrionales bacterium]
MPAGRNRLVEDDDGHRRMSIGQGEHAIIYRMLDGPFEGLVCRSPVTLPTGINTEKEVLLRFRTHQIAHVLFPDYVLDVQAVNLENREIFSIEVERSKQNLRDCTRVGILHRRERVLEPLDQDVLDIVQEMESAGVTVEANKPNVSVVRNGENTKICFFEILGIDTDKVRSWVLRHPEKGVNLGRIDELLKLYEFEIGVRDIDLMLLLRDRAERLQVLEEEGVSELFDIYNKELEVRIFARE